MFTGRPARWGPRCSVECPFEERNTHIQVKFVRNPFNNFDAHEWLHKTIGDELPKIIDLIPKGVTGYHFITNVQGTAFLDAGSIDLLNVALAKLIPIPATAWWRDDLNRRLDNAWALKWRYTELMTGQDLIRLVVETCPKEHMQRRSSAIRAFVRDQYNRDQEVRFKQIELQNKLLDLFIDVPVSPSSNFASKKQYTDFLRWWRTITSNPNYLTEQESDLDLSDRREEKSCTAADLLLHPIAQTHIRRIVIEGAPGQGKSTIGQYICQIHRMRLLNEQSELCQVPLPHRNAPLRLPFKIDLRDMSAWLMKNDPFAAEENAPPPAHWTKSLESFLAAQVRHHSGGTDFTVDDLLAIFKLSSVLLVFDGLDEVADIARRQEVVNEIVRGVNRLEENCASLQSVVTSRPAAFANSPGLPEKEFYHFHLDSITPKLIQRYAEKWLKARKLYGRESTDVRRILREKMDQPHLRDLARNPMQLAILLSLIHRRGSSLPDKRTALYDNYIDLFFSREAEKSTIVREHRDLLIDLHRYVAWLLHTEAEKGGTHTGSISVERLQGVLTEYLKSEHHDTGLVTELFHGMVERVIALVSRVQGTLEFEVQPLREYFAARYLYETAPYSPPGNERKGTKPDRFDAIARNFYWLNVCRFYAGCFSKGELPALVDRLEELTKDDNFKKLSHPRVLAAILLSDWVFSQHPRSVAEVVNLITDPLGLRYVVTSPSRKISGASALVLPKRNGNEELLKKCFSILRTRPPRDFALDVIDVIKANSNQSELIRLWQEEIERTPKKHLSLWLEYGSNLGVLAITPPSFIEDILRDSLLDTDVAEWLFKGKQWTFIEESDERFSIVVDLILDGKLRSQPKSNSILGTFANVMQPSKYAHPSRQLSLLASAELDEAKTTLNDYQDDSQIQDKCARFIKFAEEQQRGSSDAEWAKDLEHWNNLVEFGRSLWGDRWQFFIFANFAALCTLHDEYSPDYVNLLDHSISLCKRCCYARSHSGALAWWKNQLSNATTILEDDFVLLTIFACASGGTIRKLSKTLSQKVDKLPEDRWQKLLSSLRRVVAFSKSTRREPKQTGTSRISLRFVTLLAVRTNDSQKYTIFKQHFANYKGKDTTLLEYWTGYLLGARYHAGLFFPNLLSRAYLAGVSSNRYAYHMAVRARSQFLTKRAADRITSNPSKYPGFLIGIAEKTIREAVAEKIVPIIDIANKDGWFMQSPTKTN